MEHCESGEQCGNGRDEAGEKPLRSAECSKTLARKPGEHPDESRLCVKSTRLRLWTHAGKQAAHAYHVDDLLNVWRDNPGSASRAQHTDLEFVANAVTNKSSRYMGTTLMNTSAGYSFGIDRECVEILFEE